MKNISQAHIVLNDFLKDVYKNDAGGVVVFIGTVRDYNRGRNVDFLEYEAYEPMAEKMMAEILNNAKEKWNLSLAKCVHRIGKVDVAEPAVVVVTSAPHRKEAYDANQYIIHEIKHQVPIWKKEVYEDGSYVWGNNCDCVSGENELHHSENRIL